MSQRRKVLFFIYIVGFAVPLLTIACASQRPSLYQSWGQQLAEAGSKMLTVEDVSLLLGTPPTRCDSIEPTPMIGIQIGPEDPTVLRVFPKGAAAVAGMKAGEQISKINGTKVETGKDILVTLRAILKWGQEITIETNGRAYSITPKRPSEAKQCYWDVSAGSVGERRGVAYVNQYGGTAGHKDSEYQRFFRASCRFYDGYVVNCTCNWQE